MKESKKLYIAYGSNMDERQMNFRCPGARLIGTGEIPDYRLEFRMHATIEPCKGSKVPVLVWELGMDDEWNLDRYEGYPNYYYKDNFRVTTGGKEATAMVYIMNEGYPLSKPYERYFETIEKAYKKFGFNCDGLYDAYDRSGKE